MKILHFPSKSTLNLFCYDYQDGIVKSDLMSFWQMITTSVTLFCSIVIASISLMCMNRTTQGTYEGFSQPQNHKAAEPENTAFEESPVPISEPEPFTSSIPETSMILKYKETLYMPV